MKSIAWRRFAAILPTIILLALIGTGSVSGSGRLTGSQAVAAAQGNLPAEVVALRTASAADEAQVAPRVLSAAKAVTVTIDALANRHAISPYVYGFAYPNSAADITDSGATEVRWGGDATSTYNWQLETYNAAADYYFEDYAASGFNNGSDGSSTQFITDVKNAGADPLMTMVMLPWVSQSPETSVDTRRHGQLSLELFGRELWPAVQRRSLQHGCGRRLEDRIARLP